MSARAFTRALKSANITNDKDLLEFVKRYDEVARRSGVRALQDYVIKLISGGVNEATLTELFGVLNVAVPKATKAGKREGADLTQNVYYKIRKAVKSKHGANSKMYEKSLTKMRFDQEKWRKNKAEYNKRIVEANKNPVQYSWEQLKENLNILAVSDKLTDMLLFLQLCCGARIGELIYYSNFAKTKTTSYVRQNKILKAKDIRHVIKPVLYIPPSIFIRLFKNVREMLKPLNIQTHGDTKQLNAKINRRLKKLWGDPKIHTHDLRKIYADVSYKTYASNQQKSYWVSSVLGHDLNSLNVSAIYTTVSVKLTAGNLEDIKLNRVLHVIQPDEEHVPVPQNPKKRDGRVLERLQETVEALQHNGVKITARKLKEYGYSSRTIQAYNLK